MSKGVRQAWMSSKIWERDLIDEEIQSLMSAFGDFAKVSCTHNVSIISLICNVAKTSSILERVSHPPRSPLHDPPAVDIGLVLGQMSLAWEEAAMVLSDARDCRRECD